ncbi:hypothetical protein GSY74_06635 [Sulfurovum sp. bin170]|uniref:hypothetical protein n=1 Tax=Sulfurovum sp. bin170 TaxID=2695268 RepID=UPI0013E03162|nr:hypothetical protein [Sulfurovum sp. bin170]NEW60957.1 hypothetical protein [Sulfurovum sp. bin170]
MKRLCILIFLGSLVEAESVITNLTLNQNNTISSSSSIKNNSNVEQGIIEVYNSIIRDSTFTFTNKIINSSKIKDNSNIRQSAINLQNTSTIKSSTIILDNTISDSDIYNTDVDQSIINLNDSLIENSTINTENIINNITTGGHNTIIQVAIDLSNKSIIKGSTLTLKNTIDDAYIYNSYISQSEFIATNASIVNSTIKITNEIIEDSKITDNSQLIQGKITVASGVKVENAEITIESILKSTIVENSDVQICGVNINNDYSAELSVTCSDTLIKIDKANVTIGMTTI